jgi:aspartate/methionine/tyrosine aminotransferase
MNDEPLLFPYMVWAHTEAFVSAYSLAQSGMPPPDAALLGDPPAIDLSPPAADALPALRERLAELFGLPPGSAAERILPTAGASGAMRVAAQRWFRPGARVVTDVPSYEPFRALPPLVGAELRTVERRFQDGWRLDVDAVRRELSGSRPGHVFLANPHNPTGALLDAEEVRALAAAAADHGGLLVSNEIYMEFARPDERVHAFALAENAVSIGSLTKAYGLGPLRIGWLLLPESLTGELPHLTDLTYLDHVDLPTPALRLGRRALDRLEVLLAPARRFEAECGPPFRAWLEASREVAGPAPALGLAAFPRVEGVADTRALAADLARSHQVDVAPGEFFGLPGHVRVGFGVPLETLREGLARLDAGIAAHRAGLRGAR